MPGTVAILGVPSDLGANVAGTRLGPAALRSELIPRLEDRGIAYESYGDVPVPVSDGKHDPAMKNLDEIRQVCQSFLGRIPCDIPDCFPLVLGGDHTLTTCLVGEIATRHDIGLVYLDAHGDFNTPDTSPSGNVHGMVVARISGNTMFNLLDLQKTFIPESRIALIGTRDVDPEEDELLKASQITVFGMNDVRRLGIRLCVEQAIVIAKRGTIGYHVSVDIDVVDPEFAPGVSTPVPGGLTVPEAAQAMRILGANGAVSADFVELNPARDVHGQTARMAAGLATTLLRSRP